MMVSQSMSGDRLIRMICTRSTPTPSDPATSLRKSSRKLKRASLSGGRALMSTSNRMIGFFPLSFPAAGAARHHDHKVTRAAKRARASENGTGLPLPLWLTSTICDTPLFKPLFSCTMNFSRAVATSMEYCRVLIHAWYSSSDSAATGKGSRSGSISWNSLCQQICSLADA
jgi:hypothetical protein